MNKLSKDKQAAVVAALVEGCSIRSTERMTGVARHTILRLLESVGTACAEYLKVAVRNVPAKRVQIDEIWSFVGCKQKNVTIEKAEAVICGDVWTFVAIDADTKLAISHLVGRRDAGLCVRVPSGRSRALVESHSVDHGRPQDVPDGGR